MGSPKLPQKVFIFAQPHQMCKSTHRAFDSALHLHPLPPLPHTPSLSPPLSFSFFLWNRLSPLPVMPLLFLLLLQFLLPVTSSKSIPPLQTRLSLPLDILDRILLSKADEGKGEGRCVKWQKVLKAAAEMVNWSLGVEQFYLIPPELGPILHVGGCGGLGRVMGGSGPEHVLTVHQIFLEHL